MIAVTDGKDIHSLVANGADIVVNLILNFSLIHYTARHELNPECILLDKNILLSLSKLRVRLLVTCMSFYNLKPDKNSFSYTVVSLST